jgi:hypothetical protein
MRLGIFFIWTVALIQQSICASDHLNTQIHLILAVLAGDVEAVRHYLDATPLIDFAFVLAAQTRHFSVVEIMLNRNPKPSIVALDHALLHTAIDGNPQMAALILAQHPSPAAIRFARHIAQEHRHDRLAQTFASIQPDSMQTDLAMLLFLSVQTGIPEKIRHALAMAPSREAIAMAFIQAARKQPMAVIDLFFPYLDQMSPSVIAFALMSAASTGNPHAIRLLLSEGRPYFDALVIDFSVWIAVTKNNVGALKMLVLNGKPRRRACSASILTAASTMTGTKTDLEIIGFLFTHCRPSRDALIKALDILSAKGMDSLVNRLLIELRRTFGDYKPFDPNDDSDQDALVAA